MFLNGGSSYRGECNPVSPSQREGSRRLVPTIDVRQIGLGAAERSAREKQGRLSSDSLSLALGCVVAIWVQLSFTGVYPKVKSLNDIDHQSKRFLFLGTSVSQWRSEG